TDPQEMRAEYDLIGQWLARPELSRADRRILQAERATLAPLLQQELARERGARTAARIQLALTPTEQDAGAALAQLTRTVEAIAVDASTPGVAYIYHSGERVPISATQVERLRTDVRAQLGRARNAIAVRVESAWDRYLSQAQINDDAVVVSTIAGWFGGVSDPREELIRRRAIAQRGLARMERQLAVGHWSEAASLLPSLERQGQVIANVSRAYSEGLIEGADLAQTTLEITRDASFAIAGSIAAVVAAPVVAAVAVKGVAAIGLTGAGATLVTGAATTAGTGLVVGTGVGLARGGSAAAGELVAGSSRAQIAEAFMREGGRGFHEGFMAGAAGGFAHVLGPALGVGTQLGGQFVRRTLA